MITKHYSPEGDGGGISAPEAGATDTAAPDTATEGSATEAAGGSADIPQYDVAELEAKFANGEILTKEELAFYDAYDKEAMSGEKPAPDNENAEEQPKQEEPLKAEAPEWQTNTLKIVGAKTPEEVPEKIKGLLGELSKKGAAISGFQRLMNECKAGNQVALAELHRIYGFTPAPAPAAQPAAQLPPPAQAKNGEFTKEMFMDEEKGEQFLNEFSSLKSKLADYDKRFENFEKIRATMEQREMEADKRTIQSGITDEICDLAELCKEDFGLSNVPIRSAIEQLLTTGSLGEKDILKPFADYLTLYAGREPRYDNLSMKEYYKLLNFDKFGEKLATARIEATKEAKKGLFNVKQNRGAAAAQSAPSVSDYDVQRMIDMRLDIPDSFKDENGELDPRKTPKKLLEAFNGVAA
jgi:hypothetical protein